MKTVSNILNPLTPTNDHTCTMTIIAATIGGAIKIARAIPFNSSLKNDHRVCCKTQQE